MVAWHNYARLGFKNDQRPRGRGELRHRGSKLSTTRPTVSGHATQALLALGLVTSTHEPGRRRGVYVLALVAP
jgi:hypothetical protein